MIFTEFSEFIDKMFVKSESRTHNLLLKRQGWYRNTTERIFKLTLIHASVVWPIRESLNSVKVWLHFGKLQWTTNWGERNCVVTFPVCLWMPLIFRFQISNIWRCWNPPPGGKSFPEGRRVSTKIKMGRLTYYLANFFLKAAWKWRNSDRDLPILLKTTVSSLELNFLHNFQRTELKLCGQQKIFYQSFFVVWEKNN